jgi:hypothetical protein
MGFSSGVSSCAMHYGTTLAVVPARIAAQLRRAGILTRVELVGVLTRKPWISARGWTIGHWIPWIILSNFNSHQRFQGKIKTSITIFFILAWIRKPSEDEENRYWSFDFPLKSQILVEVSLRFTRKIKISIRIFFIPVWFLNHMVRIKVAQNDPRNPTTYRSTLWLKFRVFVSIHRPIQLAAQRVVPTLYLGRKPIAEPKRTILCNTCYWNSIINDWPRAYLSLFLFIATKSY